ncbi:MAG: T9SS type A sorting domain-containing protein [Paludibacteraceae bacterium]
MALFLFVATNAQNNRFRVASSNNINVNDPYYQNANRKDIVDATFKVSFTNSGWCTGTLINRNTSDENLGYYFLTARHCIYTDNGMGSFVFYPNIDHYLYFNYQSPTADTDSTKPTNRGKFGVQSTTTYANGYEYIHKTKLRLVDKFFWGDFALFEILTPIPPHFNVAYAGWEPRRLGSVFSVPIDPLPSTLVGIHHPRGDIKKISGSNNMLWLENPISSGCYIFTTVIDFLFGWIWSNSASTQVICNYNDNPWLSVIWNYGLTEDGSSGSGLFGYDNKLIGVLSGGLEFYGKLHANYYNASIKNVLNPSNNIWVDHSGLNSRRITEFDNLVLPGGNYPEAYYFPASHYQSENKIVLQARNNITTDKPITILSDSDYEFIAGGTIELNEGFTVEKGASFTASINNSRQNVSKQKENVEKSDLENGILNKLINIKLPALIKRGNNDVVETISNTRIRCYPNPTTDFLVIELSEKAEKIELFTTSGMKLFEQKTNSNFEQINLINYPDGIYVIKVYYKDDTSAFDKFIKC